MKYIDLINRFWAVNLEASFSHLEVHLFFKLLELNNRLGWKIDFRFPNSRLESELGTRTKNLINARNRLVDYGLISYKKGTTRVAGSYSVLVSFEPTKESNKGSNQDQTPTKESNQDSNKGSNQGSNEGNINKNRKEKNISLYISRDEEREIFELFYFKNFTKPLTEVSKFINHYEAQGWCTSKGAKITNVIALANSWEQHKTKDCKTPYLMPSYLLTRWKTLFNQSKAKIGDDADVLLRLVPQSIEDNVISIKCQDDEAWTKFTALGKDISSVFSEVFPNETTKYKTGVTL